MYGNTPLSQSSNPAFRLEIRTANLGDVRGLSEVLAASFYSHRGLMFWLYPLLRLGICEDLRARLKSSAPYYSCLTAIAAVDAPREPEIAPTRTVAGTVEIALRSDSRGHPARMNRQEPWESEGERHPEYLYISNLAVSPPYRRQGIARKLLLSCEPLALRWGYPEIYLHVWEHNERAKQLYLNLGYDIERVESERNYWLWSRPKCLLLRKSLMGQCQLD